MEYSLLEKLWRKRRGVAGELEKMEFTFCSPGKLVYGKGAIEKVGEEVSAVEKMGELNRKIGLAKRLSEVGVKEDGLEECAALAMADACLMTNPRKPEDPQELLEVYRKVL